MKIGIIGPGNVKNYCERAKIKEENYKKIIKQIALIIAKTNSEIVITPDKGATSELFAMEYSKSGGKKVYEIVPLDDKEFGYSWVNLDLGEHINCGTWRNQPEALCENSELLICIGWGGGTLAEIYYTRWFGKIKKVYVIEELIDEKLPASLEKSLKTMEYIKANELMNKLK